MQLVFLYLLEKLQMLCHFASEPSEHLIIILRLASVSFTLSDHVEQHHAAQSVRTHRPPAGEVMLCNVDSSTPAKPLAEAEKSKVQLLQGSTQWHFALVAQAELMSGFIEFCVELKSASEGAAAAAEVDGAVPQPAAGQEGGSRNGRGGRRGMLHRQNSVVCSRVHTLSTINYVDNGELLRVTH